MLSGFRVSDVNYRADENLRFEVLTEKECFFSHSLVTATGGLSIPQIGATDFGYRIAKKFGINIIDPYPALVPFMFDDDMTKKYNRKFFADNAGLSFYAEISTNYKSKKISFKEKKEYEDIEKQIPILESKKAEIEQVLYGEPLEDFTKITALTEELAQLSQKIDTLTDRWLELAEKLG